MSEAVHRFYNAIEDAESLPQRDLIAFFTYFLTIELGEDAVTAVRINQCFELCDLPKPGNTAARLSHGLKAKPADYVKSSLGYRLARRKRDEIAKRMGAHTAVIQTSATLRGLEHRVPAGNGKDFLEETIVCFEAGSNRAAITMAWTLAVNHLFEHILAHKLGEFNTVLAANTDKRVKVKSVSDRDDFGDIPEGKFIEFCRSARIISNDVRRILETKLGIRNSSAHPSGIKVTNTKAIEFVEDLVENVVLKYPT